MSDSYNWWEDPKNKLEVDRISWWNHSDNMTTYPLPISVIHDGEWCVVTGNDETKKLLGEYLNVSSQGKTREEAISDYFKMLRFNHEFILGRELKFQRWVPLQIGPWGHIGGSWFSVYGIHVHFRYGKGMKGGRYIPYTLLNISMSSDWMAYKRWKKNRKNDS